MNACHGSASPPEAAREIHFFFPTFVVDPLPTAAEANAYLEANIYPKLTEGLTLLAKEKPTNAAVCYFFLYVLYLFIYLKYNRNGLENGSLNILSKLIFIFIYKKNFVCIIYISCI